MRLHTLRTGLLVSLLLLISATASAQSTLRVLRSAVVLEAPAGDAPVLGTVLAGELLDLLDERGSWYLVRPPNDGTQREWRTAWINRAMVEPLSAVGTKRTQSATGFRSRPRTSTRPPSRLRGELYSYPGTETSLGWAWVSDEGLASPLGLSAAMASNFNSWIGLTVEGGAHFFSADVFGYQFLDAQAYTILAGPKFTLRTADRVAPFARLLAGPAYLRGSFFGFEGDVWVFALQPGGGIDIVLTDGLALRFGVDTPISFNSGIADKDFRFTAGVTFRSNFK